MKQSIAVSSRGFTLIELMVVISIVALLSSIVLASVKSVTSKGGLAAGRTFSSHTRDALADDAIAYFDFDDASNHVKNNGVTFNNGQLGTNGSIVADTTLKNRGYSLLNLASADTAFVWSEGGSSPMMTQAFANSSYTMMLWYRPNNPTCSSGFTTPSAGYCVLMGDLNTQHTGLSIRPTSTGINSVAGWAWDSGAGVVRSVIAPTDIKTGDWVHVALTVNGTKMTLYVNGKATASPTPVGPSSVFASPLVVGGVCCTNGAWGSYDDVAVYGKPLLAYEVEQVYAAGLPTHSFAMKDDEDKETE